MTTLTTTNRQSLLDDLHEAKQLLNEVIALVDQYVRYTGDAAAEAYILDKLRIFAGRDHGFLSGDLSINNLIEALANTNDAAGEPKEPAAPHATKHTADGRTLYWCNSLGRYVSIPVDGAGE